MYYTYMTPAQAIDEKLGLSLNEYRESTLNHEAIFLKLKSIFDNIFLKNERILEAISNWHYDVEFNVIDCYIKFDICKNENEMYPSMSFTLSFSEASEPNDSIDLVQLSISTQEKGYSYYHFNQFYAKDDDCTCVMNFNPDYINLKKTVLDTMMFNAKNIHEIINLAYEYLDNKDNFNAMYGEIAKDILNNRNNINA